MFDIAGVTILVILVVVFGFLTLRAWKAKNRWLKWIGALLSGLLTLIWALYIGLSGKGMFVEVAMLAVGAAVFYLGRLLEARGRGGRG